MITSVFLLKAIKNKRINRKYIGQVSACFTILIASRLWEYVRERTGVDLKAIFEQIANERVPQEAVI